MRKNLHSFVMCLFTTVLAGTQICTAQAPGRKVLLEEFTTASCGNCPMMSKFINDWHVANAGGTILMAIHQGSGVDAMSGSNSAAIFNAMHPAGGWFAPAIMIDRGLYPWTDSVPYMVCMNSWGSGTGAPGRDTIATRLMNEPAKVGVNISGNYNSATRTINATVTANIISALPSGDWRINLFLVEDSVVGYPGFGAFAGWDQHCYDTPWANANYPGMFDGTSIIGYPHRHVMRKSFLGDWGLAGVIPAVPSVSTFYSVTTSLVVDTAVHDNHMSLVAFVSLYGANQNQKWVVNANDVEVSASFATGINDNEIAPLGNVIESIYPNPFTSSTTISFNEFQKNTTITITNLLGQVIKTVPFSGKQFVLEKGMMEESVYFVRIESGDGMVYNKKVILK